MTTSLPNVGEVKALDDWLGTTTPEAQVLKLYTNNVTPAEGDTAGSYTEASGGGYSSKSLVRATWGAASTAAGVTTKAYPAQTWTFTGSPGTIYGYFVVGASSGTLLWSELLYPSGQAFANGDTLTITPQVAMD